MEIWSCIFQFILSSFKYHHTAVAHFAPFLFDKLFIYCCYDIGVRCWSLIKKKKHFSIYGFLQLENEQYGIVNGGILRINMTHRHIYKIIQLYENNTKRHKTIRLSYTRLFGQIGGVVKSSFGDVNHTLRKWQITRMWKKGEENENKIERSTQHENMKNHSKSMFFVI